MTRHQLYKPACDNPAMLQPTPTYYFMSPAALSNPAITSMRRVVIHDKKYEHEHEYEPCISHVVCAQSELE